MSTHNEASLEQLRRAVLRRKLRKKGEAVLLPSARPIPSVPRTDRLPLSFAQQRLWLVSALDASADRAYHLPSALRLSGSLDRGALKQALDGLLARHESLRTCFVAEGGVPYQRVVPDGQGFVLREDDARAEDDVTQAIAAELATPFDLSNGPLIRGRLLRLSEQEHVLVLNQHHIVSDGWSSAVMVRDLAELYRAACLGERDGLVPLPIQYADYAHWQRHTLQGDMLQRQLDFWRGHLAGAPELLELPLDHPRPPTLSYAGGEFALTVPASLTEGLRELAQRHGATVYMVLMAAWSLLLSRLSGQSTVVVATPVAGRNRHELEGLIGFFVNTLAFCTRLEEGQSVAQLIEAVRRDTLAAFDHQNLPFEQVVEAVRPARSLSHAPVAQASFTWHNQPEGGALALPGLSLQAVKIAQTSAQADLMLSLSDTGSSLEGALIYASDLFDEATVARWSSCFLRLLEGFVADETQEALRVPLLPEVDYRQVVDAFNVVTSAHPRALLAHACFEHWADLRGAAIALEFEGESISYRELDERANRVAHYLLEQGAAPDDRVVLCVERGVEYVVGVLGILKAGCAYVPLDPDYPSARLSYMVNDSAPLLVLTQASVAAQLPPVDVPVLRLDADLRRLPTTRPMVPALRPAHLAYLIYTSGSTGEPKAVMVEHCQLCHLAASQGAVFGDLEGSRVLQFASPSFDASVWEWAMALLSGGTLYLAPRHRLLPGEPLLETLREGAITHATLPGSALQALGEVELPCLRTLVVAGEACPVALAERWRGRLAFFNAYGPTEGTVCASIEHCREPSCGTVPIGRPLPDTRLHVLDARGKVVPVGVVGEIYLGGAGVARGYWGREALTAERFVADNIGGVVGERLYRTGDLGRYRADGRLEYVGRADFQIKLRGHRIEIGEIETQLEALPGVAEAAVLLLGEGADARLVGYWAAAGEEAESAASLRAQLASRLPDYMLPSSLVQMAQLPRTSNGKLDRSLLPTEEAGAVAQREYEAPQGDVEEALARLWQELLNVPRVGRYDHFFELGGHSLLAVTMVERLRNEGWGAEVRALFTEPVLSAYAATLAPAAMEQSQRLEGIPSGTTRITPELLPLVDFTQPQLDRIVETVPGGAANIQDICPLLPMQTGMLFHHLLEREGDPYLSCTVIAFTERERLDDFARIFDRLIARHDILRVSLAWEGLAQPVQVIWREAHLPVHELEVPVGEDALAVLTAHTDSRRLQLDLKSAPLLSAYVVHDRASGEWLLGFVSHHLIVDHRSLELLMGELHLLLRDEAAVLPPSLPLREQVAAAVAIPTEAHESYFRERLGDVDESTAPFGILDVQQRAGALVIEQRYLAQERARRMRELARRHQVSPAVLLHVAYAVLLGACSGRDEVVFGTVLAGRMHGAKGANTALGMFVNTLPLRVRLAGASAHAVLQDCYRDLTELLAHEQAPLALAQRMSGLPASRPLFTALLNYRHNATKDGEPTDDGMAGLRFVAGYGDHANYPLTLKINDFGDEFSLTAECVDGIDPVRVLDYLERAVDGLLHALESDGAIGNFSILNEAEQRQQVEGFNDTRRDYPRDSLLHEQFALRAAEQPEAVALECDGERLCYRELDERANALANYLAGLGVGPDQRVAIVLPRGIEMVLGMLAVLKAGGAYVPLDPQQPRERLAWMLADTAPSAVLSSSDWEDCLPALDVPILRFDVECNALLRRPAPGTSAAPTVPALRADHLCYVMYTSGSTGQPKGVMVEHRQVLRLVINNPYCTLTAEDTVAHAANPAFDAATWEIWGALLAGARVVIVPQDDLMVPTRLVVCLRTSGVSAAWFSVGLFNQYEAALRPIFGQLRYLLVGGDALDPVVMARVMNASERPLHVVNGYGPTESTTFACTHELDASDMDGSPIPIGRPIANTRIYILGTKGEVLPIGATGEIFIGGDGVARGYWNQPEQTLERFLPDPFVPGARMYRSGDRGRYRADGTLEYLGRADGQVKIRGFRVETGEVEAALRAFPEIDDAAVLVHASEGGDKSLVAYVVTTDTHGTQEQTQVWRETLSRSLPDYMLPTIFVLLPAMPLNANGKLNRHALPSPEAGLRAARAYSPPIGETELALAAIWQQLLGVPQVGRDDDFFALGGHSLLAVTLSVHVQERFNVDLQLKTVFEKARLEDFAQAIEAAQLALPSEKDLSDMQAELDVLSDEELQAFLKDAEL